MTGRGMNALVVAGVMAGMILTAATAQAQQNRLFWVIQAGKSVDVDKAKAAQVYLDSCQMLEDRLEWEGQPIRPRIRVHVGEACPASEVSGPCMNPALGMLYVPEWNDDAFEALAEITVMTALKQIMEKPERELLATVRPLQMAR